MKNRFHLGGVRAAALIAAIVIALSFSACAGPGGASDAPAKDEPVSEAGVGAEASAPAIATTPSAADAVTSAAADIVTSAADTSATAGTTSGAAGSGTAGQPPLSSGPAAGQDAAAKAEADGGSGDPAGGNDKDKGDTPKEPAKKDKPPKEPAKDKDDGKGDKPSGESKSKADDKPKPKTDETIAVTIAIDCLTLLGVDPELAAKISNEGVILAETEVTVATDAKVYDVLKACGVAFVGKAYISSVAGLSEGDGGPKAGWVYSVNDTFPSVGVTKYTVSNGDRVRFRYTIDGGKDVQ
jgi:hypothetical protein